MKYFYIFILVAFLTSFTFGQNIEATTKDGRKVILKPDQTWEYVTASSLSNKPTNEKFKSIDQLLKQIEGFEKSENYSVSYNKIKDVTTASITFDILKNTTLLQNQGFDNFDLKLSSLYMGEGIKGKSVNFLCLHSQVEKEWRFLENKSLIFLFDDKNRLNLGDGEHDGDISTDGAKVKLAENNCWKLTNDSLISALGNASKIEFQYGETQVSLNSDANKMFKQYLALLSF
jgi:hypothetical protein